MTRSADARHTSAAMRRSLDAVLIGTFTLRFSTGLTGAMLVYYLAELPEFGGPEVSSAVGRPADRRLLRSPSSSCPPLFGVLSDRARGAPDHAGRARLRRRRGRSSPPLTTDLLLLGGTRWLEGAAAAASIPSILGYIALVTSHDEGLRGRTVARFEAATIAGLGLGLVAAGPLFERCSVAARSCLNAVLYGVIVRDLPLRRTEPAGTPTSTRSTRPPSMPAARASCDPAGFDFGRYARLLASSARLAAGADLDRAERDHRRMDDAERSSSSCERARMQAFADQLLMGGFAPTQVSIGLAVALVVFFAGLFVWGGRFRRYPSHDDHGHRRRRRDRSWSRPSSRSTTPAAGPSSGWRRSAAVALAGSSCWPARRPPRSACWPTSARTHPDDRGAIMGLYSVFLGVGQIIGSVASGAAADWRGIDGLLLVSLAPAGHRARAAALAARLRASRRPALDGGGRRRLAGVLRAIRR